MIDFYTLKYPVAKKEHKCSLCGGTIKIGEQYKRYSGKYEGDMFDHKYCADCERCLNYYLDVSKENEYSEDWISDTLQEDFCHDCIHGFRIDDCLDDCEENVWHCPIIQKAIKGA